MPGFHCTTAVGGLGQTYTELGQANMEKAYLGAWPALIPAGRRACVQRPAGTNLT
jgi:hypothetical protein